MSFKVIENENPLHLHALVSTYDKGLKWIERYGNSGMFTDKTLNKKSFKVVKAN